ncbi:glycosyltransferase family 39 protein [Patescibacteria group bacterium]|nr:glycosyltransferase family 39 protein [Patescibacteria group bacterium]
MDSFLTEKRKKIILILVFCLAIFLIVFRFTSTPKVWVDEGLWTNISENFAFHGKIALQKAPGEYVPLHLLLSVGYPVIFPVAASMKIFGSGIVQARLPMIMYMFAFVLLAFLYTYKKFGFYTAIISLLLIISYSPFYGNGRPVQGEVPGLFYLLLTAWFLWLLQNTGFNSKKWALLVGVAWGLSASTKPIFFLALSLAILLNIVIFNKTIRKNIIPGNILKILLSIITGFIIPMTFWFETTFPPIKSIFQIIPTYLTFILYFTSDHKSSPIIPTIFHNVMRFFTESTPILFTLILTTILIYYIFSYFNKKNNKEADISEWVILLFIIINILGYLKGTGWYRYFFPAQILVYILFPFSFFSLLNFYKDGKYKKILLLAPIILIAIQFYHLVFLSDTSMTFRRTLNTQLSKELSKIDSDKSILFYNSVEAVVFLKGSNYSQYIIMDDFLEVGNKSALLSPKEDFLLVDSRSSITNFSILCYESHQISHYLLYNRKSNCK